MPRTPEASAPMLVEPPSSTMSGFLVGTDGTPDSDGAVRVASRSRDVTS